MREILFRGKRDYNGEWVEGSLLAWPDGSTEMCYPNPKDGDELLKVIVWPETVGQFTGLIDKNGKRIFEGDIVNVLQGKDKGVASVGFENGTFMLYPRTGNIYERSLWAYWYNDWDVEIIGNIHDNPELLGGTAHE